jgi:sulfite exporter TauE/SafE
MNGFAFALLTSPSLFLAMRAQNLLKAAKAYYSQVMGILALLVGALAIARGLAEIQVIDHLVLNPAAPHNLRLIIF